MTNDSLIISYKNGNKDDLNQLLENNIKLIRFAASKFHKGANEVLDLDDLIQEASIGFLKAVELYDLEKENKASFSTYAFYHMNGSMIRFLKNNSKNNETSIYQEVPGVDDEIHLIDQLHDEDSSNESFDYVYKKQLKIEIEELLNKELTLYERNIIKAYYGFYGECYKRSEIAEALNTNIDTIKNKHIVAIRKLYNSSYIRVLKKERMQTKLTKALFNPEYYAVSNMVG